MSGIIVVCLASPIPKRVLGRARPHPDEPLPTPEELRVMIHAWAEEHRMNVIRLRPCRNGDYSFQAVIQDVVP